MKKRKKFIMAGLAVMVVLASLLLLVMPALAVNVGTRNTTNLFQANGSSGWGDLKTPEHYIVGSSPEQVAYCLQHKNDTPSNSPYGSSDILGSYSSRVQTGLRIILENGYPYATGGLSAAEARYATANCIRFWLAENGDSSQYNYSNFGSYTDAQLRSMAASGQIGTKIRAKSGYTDVLQFSIELLIKARAQDLMDHDIGLSTPSMSISGSYFVGTSTVTLTNMNGGYTLDTSGLPSGSSVTGDTGKSGDTLTIRIPMNEANANRTFSVAATGKDSRTRSNVAAYAPNDSDLQRVITAEPTEYNAAKTVSVSFGTPQIYADLVVTALNADASTYDAGDTITISATVMNQGLRSAGGFYVALTSPDLSTQTKYISSLAVNASANVTFTYTAPQFSADRTISVVATADSTGAVPESNEGNNSRGASFVVRGLPDLIVSSLSSDETQYTAGNTISITATIKNQGYNTAAGFYVSLSSPDLSTQTKYISSLAAGASTNITFTYAAPSLTATKAITVTATADSTGVVIESNEGNNTRSATFTVLALPDLIVSSLSSDKTEYIASDTISITATIRNQGYNSASGFYVALTSLDLSTQTKYVSSLAAGASTNVIFSYTAPSLTASKAITVTATADSTGIIAETNESNNTRSTTFTVLALPDLVVPALTCDKPVYETGDTVTISATAKNTGPTTAVATTVRLTVPGIGTYAKSISALAAGASQTVQFMFTAPTALTPQSITITAYVDPDNTVQESNESNNTRTAIVAVNALRPDIVVTDSTVTDWYAGMQVTVSATVRSQTAQPVPTVAIRLSIGGASYTENIPIAGNGSNLAVFRITVPAAGNYVVQITADPNDVLDETNESNNSLTKNIQVKNIPASTVMDPDDQAMERQFTAYGFMGIPSVSSSNYHTWQEVRLESGSYVTKNFWARLTTTFTISPDSRIAYADKPRVMESGFGYGVSCSTVLTTNYDHAEKLVGAQMVWVRNLESAYGQLSQWQDVRDSLTIKTGNSGDASDTWQLKANPWSVTGSRLHYVPLWFPDGSYTAWAQAFYAWSPVGQMYEYKADALTISGDMYDRVTTIQR